MKVLVRVIAPGCKVEPYIGQHLSVQPVIVQEHVDGFEAELSAVTNWRSLSLAADRAGVLALGVIDLVLRWPLSDVHLRIELDGKAAQKPRDISRWQPYEWVPVFSWGGSLTPTVATVSDNGLCRIERLWCASISAPLTSLDALLGPLAEASSAAEATNPYDRVRALWSALELLYPRMGELRRIDAILGQSPSFAQVEEARGSKPYRRLLGYRGRLARDPWLYLPVRSALLTEPSTAIERVRVATVVSYAIRCKIAHGQWARNRDDRRLEAGAAERWLWQLLEREVEIRLAGSRLDPIRALGTIRFGGQSPSRTS
ncbi:MAG: hypothetical protein ABSA21_08355 [Candidatus Limnocylindrales bacterium]